MILSTGLGAWDTSEKNTKGEHGITFPLAIVHAAVREAGYREPLCADGPNGVRREEGIRWDAVMLSALDSRHFWKIAPFLRKWGISVRSKDRKDGDPIVIMGGQSAYSPAPVENIVDVVYVGEVEAGIKPVLDVIFSNRSRRKKLEAIADLPNCIVRSVQDDGHKVRALYADDIGISLRNRLEVNLRTIHRMEVARGCKGPSKHSSDKGTAACAFCALGWRSPYRENSAEDVKGALRKAKHDGLNEVHLSAGDAENHSQIIDIRNTVSDLGIYDGGWTGRLDTINEESMISSKNFSFGIEGASHRLRAAIGKRALTNDYIVSKVEQYWAVGGRKMMLHFIGGLPSEDMDDYDELRDLFNRLKNIAPKVRNKVTIAVGRQPFGPLPHTPMQWFAPGLSTKGFGTVFSEFERTSNIHEFELYHKPGQNFKGALISALAMRGGREMTEVMIHGAPRLAKFHPKARLISELDKLGITTDVFGEWDPEAPTPWEHIDTHWPKSLKVRRYRQIRRKLYGRS